MVAVVSDMKVGLAGIAVANARSMSRNKCFEMQGEDQAGKRLSSTSTGPEPWMYCQLLYTVKKNVLFRRESIDIFTMKCQWVLNEREISNFSLKMVALSLVAQYLQTQMVTPLG